MTEFKDGIYRNQPIEEYHASRPHVSATSIKMAKRSLKEFDWYINGRMPRKEKAHFSAGNAFELALFDEAGFKEKVAIAQTQEWKKEALKEKPELKSPAQSKKYQELQSEFLKENENKYLISDTGEDSNDMIQNMLKSCREDKTIQKLIRNTDYQLSLYWTDLVTGLRLKTRPDICQVKKNIVVNLKTALDGSPQAFSRDLAKYDYPLQACIEILGCTSTGLMEKVDKYFWLVVEKRPPYNATIYEFGQEEIEACMVDAEYYFKLIKDAQDKNEFPGYSAKADNTLGILEAYIPSFYKTSFL